MDFKDEAFEKKMVAYIVAQLYANKGMNDKNGQYLFISHLVILSVSKISSSKANFLSNMTLFIETLGDEVKKSIGVFWMNSRQKEFMQRAVDIVDDLDYLFEDSVEIPKREKIEILSTIFESFYAKLWEKVDRDENN